MPRLMLTDALWAKLSQLMHHTGRVYNKPVHRLTLEGILFRMRTGSPWRDLPAHFGLWNTVFRRFNLWSRKGILDLIFKCLTQLSDPEWLFIDGSIVKAHQHSSGAISEGNEGIGKSRGGNSTKIHLAVESGGLPVHFELSEGQVHDIKHAPSLIAHAPKAKIVIADKGYDSETLREYIRDNGSRAEIPKRKFNNNDKQKMDWCLYKYRHLVENAFCWIKKYRAISTRYDKLERNYHSMVSLAFSMMWLPMWVD